MTHFRKNEIVELHGILHAAAIPHNTALYAPTSMPVYLSSFYKHDTYNHKFLPA